MKTCCPIIVAATGQPCRANVKRGATYCAWHSPDRDAKVRHVLASQKGGMSGASAPLHTIMPIGEAVARLDLRTPSGLVAFLALALHRTAQLPFSEKTANAIAALVNSARAAQESATVTARLEALEDDVRLRRIHP